MAKDEGLEILGGIILGALGLAALAKLLGKKCPYCGRMNPPNKTKCDSCGGILL
jgi:hypothetical protein